jgi:hypothetical protein
MGENLMAESGAAYLAHGRLHPLGDGGSRVVESEFGRSLRERAIQIYNRNAWKTQGSGAQFMRGMLWPSRGGDPENYRIAITSATRAGIRTNSSIP